MKTSPCVVAALLILACASVGAVKSLEQTWSSFQIEATKLTKGQPAETGYRLTQATAFIDTALREKRYAGAAAYLAYLQQASASAPDRYKETLAAFAEALNAAQAQEGARRDTAADKIAADFVALLKAHAAAPAYDPLLQRLDALSGDEFDRQWASQTSIANQKIGQLQRFVSRWQDYLLAVNSHDPGHAQSAVQELVQLNEQTPALLPLPRSEMITVLADAQNQVGVSGEESRADLARRLDAAIGELPSQIEGAKTPADLDAPITAMANLEREINRLPYNARQGNSGDYGRATSARRLLMKWQDRLFALADGNPAKANQIISELANSTDGVSSLIPRSKLLVSFTPTKTTPDGSPVPADMSDLIPDTLEGLPAAIEAMNLRVRASGNGLASKEFSYLAGLYRAHQQLQSGDPIEAFRFVNPRSVFGQLYTALPPKLASLRQQLTVRTVTAYFDLPAEFKSTSEDGPAGVFSDAIFYAHRKADYPLLLKIVDYWQYNFPMWPESHFDLGIESRALGAYLAGLNQERALQFDMAVVSFKRSLRQPSRFLPVEEIGRHLEDIKAHHPLDFQKADKRVAEEAQRSPTADYSYPTNNSVRTPPNDDSPTPGTRGAQPPKPASKPTIAPNSEARPKTY